MLPDVNTELTKEQIEQLELARKTLPKLREQVRKAKLAGIDVSQQEKDIEALQSQLDKLYRVYVSRTSNPSTNY